LRNSTVFGYIFREGRYIYIPGCTGFIQLRTDSLCIDPSACHGPNNDGGMMQRNQGNKIELRPRICFLIQFLSNERPNLQSMMKRNTSTTCFRPLPNLANALGSLNSIDGVVDPAGFDPAFRLL